MSFAALGSLLAAIIMQLIGGAVNRKVSFLSRYNIPDPITGGLIFALLASLIIEIFDFSLTFDPSIRHLLLLMFFGGVGLCADLRLLQRGGKALLIFVAILFPFIIVQNLTGIAMAQLLDLRPLLGLVAGSIALIGGHGTAAAYTENFARLYDLEMAVEFGMMLATMGLIAGGIVGGPIAHFLIRRYGLRPETADTVVPENDDPSSAPIGTASTLLALGGVIAAVIGAEWLAALFAGSPVMIPEFLWCMTLGMAIRNLMPVARIRFNDRPAKVISSVSLSLFLVMTMMALDVLDLVRLAGPFVLIMLVQIIVSVVYALVVCFTFMGRDYEAAVTTAAFLGVSMGTTATAMANMEAITARHGPAPVSFVIVPLAGAFFVDILNALVLTFLLLLPFVFG